LRAGLRVDPSFLSVYYGAPEGADWKDRATWHLANPALSGPDAFLSLDNLEAEFRMAEALPSREAAFKQLYLNQWMQHENRWIDLGKWDASAGHVTTEADTAGRVAFGGLDVAVVNDLMVVAYALPCPSTEGAFDLFVRCYLPAGTLASHHNQALYQQYERAGYLTVVPGDVIDHGIVEADILRDAQRMTLRALNIDARFQGAQLLRSLQDKGLTVTEMPQTHAAYAEPMREFERLLQAGKLHHGGHPILRWMAENVIVKVDGNGDMRPDRARSREKIDGVVAAVMALDAAIRQPTPKAPEYQILIYGGGGR
jgi:phage terminase large subunit-like protein